MFWRGNEPRDLVGKGEGKEREGRRKKNRGGVFEFGPGGVFWGWGVGGGYGLLGYWGVIGGELDRGRKKAQGLKSMP